MTDDAPAPPVTRRDRLKQLRAFCEAVRLGSISRAATTLGSSQPAVSKQVQSLEEELGAPLLRRPGGGVVPTRIGENLFSIARPLVEGLVRLPELFDEYHSGAAAERLRIGVGEISGGYLLPEIVKRFHAHYPRTRVELRIGAGAQRLDWLRNFELDVVVAAFGVVPRDVEFHPLAQADAVVVVPEDHPLGRRESIAIEELARHPMIAPIPKRHIRQVLEVVMRLHGLRPRVVLEVDGWDLMLNHVAAGVGIALMPGLSVKLHERVRTVALEHPFRLRTYGVAVRGDRLISLAASRFVHMAAS